MKTFSLFQAVQEYLKFLHDWETEVNESDLRLTPETHSGLLVSLKNVQGLAKYLTDDLGYEYLMTRRVNQDILEVITKKLSLINFGGTCKKEN